MSWVMPRSRVNASYSLRPGDFLLLLGSPPSRCFTTSVVRLRPLTLLTPATYRPSHFTRNLKLWYGSNRWAFTLNCAMVVPSALTGGSQLGRPRELLQLDDDEFRGLQRRETHEDVDD